jgi:hypothetical protein
MGLKLNNGQYINFKKFERRRTNQQFFYTDVDGNEIFHSKKDIMIIDVFLNIYNNENKEKSIVIKHGIALPYIETISDQEIYYLLKQNIIKLKDIYDEEQEIDLSNAIDVVDEPIDENVFVDVAKEYKKFNMFKFDYLKECSNLGKIYKDTPETISELDPKTNQIIFVDNPTYLEYMSKNEEVNNKYIGYCEDIDNLTTISQLQNIKYVFTYTDPESEV